MKLKEQKKLGMLYFVLGAVLAIAGYFIKSSWLASFGGGVCVLGLVRLLRAARLSRDPDQAADYDASLQDERTAYVANKARSLTFLWGDRIFEKCGIRRDEEGDGGKTLEIRGKRRLSARDGGANYQQS